MKLNTQAKSMQSAGMKIGVDMTIDMNPKAFGVLSHGMYSDIETTIVRELSSNAWDAHIAAGKTDVPFEVSCPSALDPHFQVRDFGTGLRYTKYSAEVVNEHEGESTIFIDGDIRKEIEGISLIILNENETVNIGAILFDNSEQRTVLRIAGDYSGSMSIEFDDTLVLYSTYFRSTKEQSNEFTGAFGLGSKTPLAYTDNFIVTNRYNGVKRIYNILTNEEGMPQINLLGTVNTDECNGLEVKIAVAPDDFSDFKSAIVSQLKYFDPQPKIMNDVVKFPELIHNGEHFMIFDDLSEACPYNYSKGHACIGNNAYEISYTNNQLFNQNMVLKFAIGEVMVTASREDLQYDDGTRDTIREREREALSEYTSYILDSIDDDSMDAYEKATFLNRNYTVMKLNDPKVRAKVGDPNLRYTKDSIKIRLSGWGDHTTLRYVDVEDAAGNVTKVLSNHSHYRQYAMRWSEYNTRSGKTSRLSNSQYIEPTEHRLVFIRDNSYSFLKKIRYYLDQSSDVYSNVLTLDQYDEEGLEALKEVADDNLTLVLLSEVELPKNISTVAYGNYTTPVARLFEKSKHRFDTSKYWSEVYTPLTKIDRDAYIVCTHRCDIENLSYNDQWFLSNYLSNDIFNYDPDTVILALSRSRYEKAIGYGFKPITELIEKLKKNVKIPQDLVNRDALEEAQYALGHCNVMKRFLEMKDANVALLDEDNPINGMIRLHKVYTKRYGDVSSKFHQITQVADYMEEVDKPEPSSFVEEAIDKVKELVHNVSNELPLIDHIDSYCFYRNDNAQLALVDYANKMFSTGENT